MYVTQKSNLFACFPALLAWNCLNTLPIVSVQHSYEPQTEQWVLDGEWELGNIASQGLANPSAFKRVPANSFWNNTQISKYSYATTY